MKRPLGLLVAIFGTDGSGKSSVIKGLLHSQSLTTKGARYMHFRPMLGLHPGDDQPVTRPHGKPLRGRIISVAKLLYYLLDYRLGYVLKVRPFLARGCLVIFDRYYHDMLVDVYRYRYGGPAFLARLLGKLVPMPSLSILLDADPEVLWARKQEVSLEELRRARDAYLHLMANLPNSRIVDASRPLHEVVATVEEIICNHTSEHSSVFPL